MYCTCCISTASQSDGPASLQPYADTGESGPTAPAAESNKPAHKDPAEREEIVMIQPGGESNPAGDSEHHTSMHVPHGSKEQEEEEEKLKCVEGVFPPPRTSSANPKTGSDTLGA